MIMRDNWATVNRNKHYEVNEDGYVRNSRNGYVLTNSPNNKGYMTVSLGKRMPGQLVHTLVAEAFIPGYEPGLDVDHKNGNRKLLKKRYEAKIDPVAALLDAFVAWKLNKEAFE